MRIAALYDVHGNLPALEAVVNEIGALGVDRVVVGGDVVPGPMPRECLARLLELGVPTSFIRGNGEREVLGVLDGAEPTGLPPGVGEVLRWVAGELTPEEAEVLRSWPETARLDVEGIGAVLFCHATPRNDRDIFTRRTPEARLLSIFDAVDADLVVCGHTHMQFDRTVGRVRVVNAGSVGMPFGEPGAYWVLLDADPELRRTDYDLRAAADRILETAYPQAEHFAEIDVLNPRSAAEVLEAFDAAAVG
ncbi:MAG: metallophosphoesterase [Gemmatimonadetes bacterium]|nr:metallophosphoesterase family protein [Gemmatimonadota bacterium]NIR77482.1 metallophosphoesterase family protein [Gemmatimonadota bacterium]NIT86006.1 metallophosphoesterase family protein [Gemmatimonadota bacterium]NIU29826.1 metallophosphoesterase family protein [Gemmatimonadota bacterium]NIU34848.1 metallophosphoesterase [Gemmatimonadota bacterium]